jgi:Fe-S cluster biogenesis protein NfuA
VNDQEVREQVGKVESLLERIEDFHDPEALSVASGAVEGLLELYGEGFARVMTILVHSCDPAAVRSLAEDELVSHLLLLHGLHPDDPETRIHRALDQLRAHLLSQGSSVELSGIENGIARIHLRSSGGGCGSSSARLRKEVEQAVREAAPDLEDVQVHEITVSQLIQLDLGAAGPAVLEAGPAA